MGILKNNLDWSGLYELFFLESYFSALNDSSKDDLLILLQDDRRKYQKLKVTDLGGFTPEVDS